MQKILAVFIVLFLVVACKDVINLPEYDTFEDNEDPIIVITSPQKNETYSGLSQIPITVEFSDNYQLDGIRFQMSPTNVAAPSINFTTAVNDSTYSIDTFYTVPSTDSITYNVLIIANDIVNNITTEAYTFNTKD